MSNYDNDDNLELRYNTKSRSYYYADKKEGRHFWLIIFILLIMGICALSQADEAPRKSHQLRRCSWYEFLVC